MMSDVNCQDLNEATSMAHTVDEGSQLHSDLQRTI